MHEYAVTKNILNIAIEEANKVKATKITGIKLVIGELSSVIDESIQMYFDILTKGTIAEAATLTFVKVAAQFECKNCGNTYDKPKVGFNCPTCGNTGTLVDSSTQFYIESIEVE